MRTLTTLEKMNIAFAQREAKKHGLRLRGVRDMGLSKFDEQDIQDMQQVGDEKGDQYDDDDGQMSREEMIAKLGQLGFSASILDGMTDDQLAEILRVQSGGAEGADYVNTNGTADMGERRRRAKSQPARAFSEKEIQR